MLKQSVVRFLEKVSVTDANSCWLWNASKDRKGYGGFYLNHTHNKAHRVSYVLFNGQIPEGMLVCHMCDVPNCVNPNHLFLGTPKQNTQDMLTKNRCKAGRYQKNKTHCPQRHEYVIDNLVKRKLNRRDCKRCANERLKETRKKKKEMSRIK